MKLSLRLAVACSLIALAANPAHAVLVAAWNFNDDSSPTSLLQRTAGVASVNGTMTASSTFTDFGGSTINAVSGDAAGEAFAYQGAPGGSGPLENNGASVTFSFNLLGYAGPIFTFATQRSGTGFNSNTVAYSINGGSFIDFATYTPPTSSFALRTFDFSSVPAVNDSNFRVRITFAGATNPAGSNRIDNVQLNAVPEPSAGLFGLLLASFLGSAVARRPARAA